MSTQDDDYQAVLWPLLFGLSLLVIGLVIGITLNRGMHSAGASVVGSGLTTAVDLNGYHGAGVAHAGAAHVMGANVADEANWIAANAASVRVEGGVVKFYFASGSSALAQGAQEALADVVKGVAAGQKAIISGFHDTTGNAAQNEELAKQRAFAVRDTLIALGIGEEKIEMRKLEDTAATGTNAEARRVEVHLE